VARREGGQKAATLDAESLRMLWSRLDEDTRLARACLTNTAPADPPVFD
jgi:hypothetical protein